MFSSSDTPESLTQRQIEAIKERAVSLWGEKWLPQIVREYAKVLGEPEKHRDKFPQVMRYFSGETTPSITNLNALLMAVNCRFKMVCYSVEEKEI